MSSPEHDQTKFFSIMQELYIFQYVRVCLLLLLALLCVCVCVCVCVCARARASVCVCFQVIYKKQELSLCC